MSIIAEILSGLELIILGLSKLAILIPIFIVFGVAKMMWDERSGLKSSKVPEKRMPANSIQNSKELGVLYAELDSVMNMNIRINKRREINKAAGRIESAQEIVFADKWKAELSRIQKEIKSLSSPEN